MGEREGRDECIDDLESVSICLPNPGNLRSKTLSTTLSHSSCILPSCHGEPWRAQRRFCRHATYLIPKQTLFLPWQTRPVCRTVPRATTLMRTATDVSPATALVGRVKGDTAHSASPATQAHSSWKRSACCSAGKGKALNTCFPRLTLKPLQAALPANPFCR